MRAPLLLRCAMLCLPVALAACPSGDNYKELVVKMTISAEAHTIATYIEIPSTIYDGMTFEIPPSDQFPDGLQLELPPFIDLGIELPDGYEPGETKLELPLYAWVPIQKKQYSFEANSSKKLETNWPGYIVIGAVKDDSVKLRFEEKIPLLNVKPTVTVPLTGDFVWGEYVQPEGISEGRMRIGASVVRNPLFNGDKGVPGALETLEGY